MKFLKQMAPILFMTASMATAGEIDNLVNKLVEKGTLTGMEGREIITATQEEQKLQIAKGTQSMLPKWLQTFNMKGDFRFRYQKDDKDGSVERERERLRLRLGIESKVASSIKIATGLATGGTDHRSTNQTLENNFEPKNINLDYMFADMILTDNLNASLGKIKNPLYNAGDLLWDTDINPEGLSVSLNFPSLIENLDFSVNSAYLVLDEVSANKNDPYMYAFQPVVKYSFTEDITLKTGVAYYGYSKVEGSLLEKTAGSNSGLSKDKTTGKYIGALKYDYDSIKGDIEFGVNSISDLVPYIGIFAEYLSNFDPSSDNKGYLYGFKTGHKKVSEPMQWQVQVSNRKLEKDACLDILPDSDFYGGKTNVKGYEAAFSIGLYKNTLLGLDFYKTENLSGHIVEEKLFQADLIYKF